MQNVSPVAGSRRGFALITVMASLAILTILFSITSEKIMARMLDGNAEIAISERLRQDRDILEFARVFSLEEIEYWSEVRGEYPDFILQDVGGLIDLNTATTELIGRLMNGMGMGQGAIDAYQSWRGTPRRLVRVSDFLRITGASGEHLEWLESVATVHSGRRGIAPEKAPKLVLDLFGAETPEDLPSSFRSAASGANFNVLIRQAEEDGRNRLVGTVHRRANGTGSRILWMK